VLKLAQTNDHGHLIPDEQKIDCQMWSYGIVGFNVPLDILKVISEKFLRVRWPDQQRRSTEGRWLVNHIKGQSHEAQLAKREREGCKQIFNRRQRRSEAREQNQARSKPDTVDRPVRTACTFVHHYNSTQYCNTDSLFLYSPSSRPASHLRCGQVKVRGRGQNVKVTGLTD